MGRHEWRNISLILRAEISDIDMPALVVLKWWKEMQIENILLQQLFLCRNFNNSRISFTENARSMLCENYNNHDACANNLCTMYFAVFRRKIKLATHKLKNQAPSLWESIPPTSLFNFPFFFVKKIDSRIYDDDDKKSWMIFIMINFINLDWYLPRWLFHQNETPEGDNDKNWRRALILSFFNVRSTKFEVSFFVIYQQSLLAVCSWDISFA